MSTHRGVIRTPNSGARAFSLIMSALLIVTLFASALAVAGGPLRASAQAAPSLADAVPSGSVLYMDIQLDQSSEQWTQSYALLDRAGLSSLAEDELNASPQDVGQLAEMNDLTGTAALVFTSAEGLTADTVTDFAGDATSMAASPTTALDTGDVPEGFAVVIQPNDPTGLYTQLENMVAQEAEQAGTTVETMTYGGTEIQYWTSTDPYTDPTAVALIDGTVVLSVRPDDIEPIIDTLNGDTPALSTDEGFSEVRSALQSDAISFGYVDGTAFSDQFAAEMAAEGLNADQFTGNMDAWVGWVVYASTDGFHMDTVTVPASADYPAPDTFDPQLAAQFPADALFFINGSNLTGTGIFDLFGFALQAAFADMEEPGATPMATPTVEDVYDQLEAMLGFNLKTDLFDQMSGEFAAYVNVADITTAAPVLDAVFVSDVTDPQTVADATAKIAYIASSGADEAMVISERQVEGGAVTSIEIAAETTAGMPVAIEYGVVNDQLLVGVNGGIDAYLDGATTRLADDPVYQQTLAALPQDNIVGVQFVNIQNILPLIEEVATALSTSMDMVDADEACGDYATQEEAQAAYDADPVGLWNLDLNYDGVACEDYFDMGGTPEGSPEAVTDSLNLLSIGTVSHVDGDLYRTSTILLIGGE